MTRQIINVGTADKGNGDPIRTAFIKANANFAELYNILSNNTGGSIITTDVIGSVFADDSTLLVDGINGRIPYSVLSGAPTIPAAQVQSNWTASSGMGVILNKPTLFSGSYTDLTSKPTIPTLVSQLANDSGFLTSVSNISNIRSEGNVNIDINLSDSTLRRWQFGEDGDTVFPNNVSINYSGNNVQFPRIIADSGKAFSIQGQGNTGSTALAWTVNPDAASQYAAVSVSRAGGDNLAKVVLQAQSDSGDAGTAKTWKFNETGTLTLPNGSVIKDTDGLAVAIGDAAGSSNQGSLAVAVGAGAGYTGQGTSAVAIGRDAGGTAQGINAVAIGDAAGGTAQGINAVAIGIQAGYANQAANSIIINATGETLNQTVANTFTVKPVRQGETADAMYYNSSTGEITYAGAFSFSVAADDSTQRLINADEVVKFIGAGGITTASDAEGNITITGSGGSSLVNGAYTVSLSNTGTLTLPAGGTITEGGGISGAIKLTPSGGANEYQALLIYPTAGADGDHIHLTAAGGTTELYLGSDNHYVKLASGGVVRIQADDGVASSAAWVFGTNGELALPNNGKITSGVDAAQVGSTTTIALNSLGTDQANNNINVGIEWTGNEAVFTTYAAGSTITFANGDVRTITDIQKNEVYGEPGVFAIDIYWSTGTPRENLTAFPITLKTSNYAAAYTAPEWRFGTNGSLTFPDSTVQTTAARPFSFSVAADDSTQRAISNNELIKFIGAGGVTTASDAEGNITITGSKVIGSWTVTNGTSTYSFTLPSDGTYVMWVKGNIANGIITWNATASVTNTNVPAIGSQYAWNYTGGGSPILLTAIPDQIRGSAGTISTDATYAGTTSNRFDFGISNTTGSSQTVYYGYTKIS